jgi:broad specificity phosphatase PhoE
LRARETADIVAQRIGLQPREDARLMETDAGDWTNRSFADVQAQAPELFAAFVAADPRFAFPGGESFAEQEVRVGAALDDVQKGELPALVVCHGMVIRAALSVRVGRWLPYGQRVPNGALVPLEPSEAELAELGRSTATQAS